MVMKTEIEIMAITTHGTQKSGMLLANQATTIATPAATIPNHAIANLRTMLAS
jgi:hypothetical protein